MTDDNFDPWSTPPKDKKKKPTNNAGSNNSAPPTPPDLKRPFKKLGEQWRDFMGGGKKPSGGASGNPNSPQKINWKPILIVILGIWLVSSPVFMLSSGEKAVILRFGEYYRTGSEGLNFKFPYPIEKKFVKSVTKVNQFEVGADAENLMVTSDENIADVNTQFYGALKTYKTMCLTSLTPTKLLKPRPKVQCAKLLATPRFPWLWAKRQGAL